MPRLCLLGCPKGLKSSDKDLASSKDGAPSEAYVASTEDNINPVPAAPESQDSTTCGASGQQTVLSSTAVRCTLAAVSRAAELTSDNKTNNETKAAASTVQTSTGTQGSSYSSRVFQLLPKPSYKHYNCMDAKTYKQDNPATDANLLEDINIRMQYVNSLDYDEDLFNPKESFTDVRKTVEKLYCNIDNNEYEIEVLDDQLFDVECDNTDSARTQCKNAGPEKQKEPPQVDRFSWQQEGVVVQDADLVRVPQLSTEHEVELDKEPREKGVQKIKIEELSSPVKIELQLDMENDYHQGFKCNICSSDIKGFRYVCVQCADFDLCARCEARRAHDQHYVLRIPGPRPHSEIQATLQAIRRTLMDAVINVVNSEPIEVKDEEECFEDPIGLQPTRVGTPSADNSESDDAISTHEDEILEGFDTLDEDNTHIPSVKTHPPTKCERKIDKHKIQDKNDQTPPKKPRYVNAYPAVKCDKKIGDSDRNIAESDQNFANSDQNIADGDQNIVNSDQNVAEHDQNIANSDQNVVENDQSKTPASGVACDVPVVQLTEKPKKSVDIFQKQGASRKPIVIKKVTRVCQLPASSLTSSPRASSLTSSPRAAAARNQLLYLTRKPPAGALSQMKSARVAVERLSKEEIIAATIKRSQPATRAPGDALTHTTRDGDEPIYIEYEVLELT